MITISVAIELHTKRLLIKFGNEPIVSCNFLNTSFIVVKKRTERRILLNEISHTKMKKKYLISLKAKK